MVRRPTRLSAIDNPIVMVVLPSPSGVGVIAVTSMYFPLGRPSSRFIRVRATFALYRPYRSSSSGSMPSEAAISAMGRSAARCAISRSDSIVNGLQYGFADSDVCGRRTAGDALLAEGCRTRHSLPGRLGGSADGLEADGADLVFGDLGRGVERSVGEEVRRGVRELDEGHEDGAGLDGLGEESHGF